MLQEILIFELHTKHCDFYTVLQIIVKDKDNLVSGKFCASYTDPHQRTFDGRYFSNQRAGEFLLYRHKTLPYTVISFSLDTNYWFYKINNFMTCIDSNFSIVCVCCLHVYISQPISDIQELVFRMINFYRDWFTISYSKVSQFVC
jgi:hypothetical protein